MVEPPAARPEPDSEMELNQQLTTVQHALELEAARAQAAQQVFTETETTTMSKMSEAHEVYVSRIRALEEEVATLVAANPSATMSSEAVHGDVQSLGRSQLLLQLAAIQQGLDEEIANRAAAEAALSAVQAGKMKRAEAYIRRKGRAQIALVFAEWAEGVAFDVAERRRTAEAMTAEVMATEEAANETQMKMSAALTGATEVHAARAYSLEKEVEALEAKVKHQTALESELKHQLALAQGALVTEPAGLSVVQDVAKQETSGPSQLVDPADLQRLVAEKAALAAELSKVHNAHSALVATQEEEKAALEAEVDREHKAHSEFVATQDRRIQQMREEIADAHRQELAVLQQALEAEMAAKELLVDKALSAEEQDQDIKAQARENLEAGKQAMQRHTWQVAIDSFEAGIRHLGSRDQELTRRLRDAKTQAVTQLGLQTKARQEAQSKLELGTRTAKSENWTTAAALFESGLQIAESSTNDEQLTKSLEMALAETKQRILEEEADAAAREIARGSTRKKDGHEYAPLESDESAEDPSVVLTALCADEVKPVHELIKAFTVHLNTLPSEAMLNIDQDGTSPLHVLCRNRKVTFRWLAAALTEQAGGPVGAKAMLTRDHHETTPMHLLCENEALTEDFLASILSLLTASGHHATAVMTETKDAKAQTPLDRLTKMLSNTKLPGRETKLDLEIVGSSTVQGSSWQQRISRSYLDAIEVAVSLGTDDIGPSPGGHGIRQSAIFRDPETAKWLAVGLRPLLQDAMSTKDEGTTPLHKLMHYMCRQPDAWSTGKVCEEWLDEALKPFEPNALLNADDSGEMPLHVLCRQESLEAAWLIEKLEPLGRTGMDSQDTQSGDTVLHHLCKKRSGLSQGTLLSILASLPSNAMLTKNKQRITPLHILCANPSTTPEYLVAVLDVLPAKAILTPGNTSSYRSLQAGGALYEQVSSGKKVTWKKHSGSLHRDEVVLVNAFAESSGALYVHLSGNRGWAVASAANGEPLLEALDGTPLDELLDRICGTESTDVDRMMSWKQRLSRAFVQRLGMYHESFDATPEELDAYKAECIERLECIAKLDPSATEALSDTLKPAADTAAPEPENNMRERLEALSTDELTAQIQALSKHSDIVKWLVVALKALLVEAMLTEAAAQYIVIADNIAVKNDLLESKPEPLDLRRIIGNTIAVERTCQVRGNTWVKHQLGWSELTDASGNTVLERTTPLHDLCTDLRLTQAWLDAVLEPLPAKAMLTTCDGGTRTPLDQLSSNDVLTADWLASVLKPLPGTAMEGQMMETLILQRASGLSPGPLKNLLLHKQASVTIDDKAWGASTTSGAASAQRRLDMESRLASAYVFALCDNHDLPTWTADSDHSSTELDDIKSSAEASFSSGDFEKAEQDLVKAIELSPVDHELRVAKEAAHTMMQNRDIAAWLKPMVKPHYQAKLEAAKDGNTALHVLCTNKLLPISELVNRLMTVLQLLPRDVMLTPGKSKRSPLHNLCERPRARPNDSIHVGGLKPPHISPSERWQQVPEAEDVLRVKETFAKFGRVKSVNLRRRDEVKPDGTQADSWARVQFENPKSVTRAVEAQERLKLTIRALDAEQVKKSKGGMKKFKGRMELAGARPGELTLELPLAGLKRLPASAKQIILRPENEDLAAMLDEHFRSFAVTMTTKESLQSWCEVYDPLVDALADESELKTQSLHKSGLRHMELGSGGWARKLVKNLPKELPTAAIVRQIMESPAELQNAEVEGDVEAYMDALRAELGGLKILELKHRALDVGVSEADLADHQMTLPQVPYMVMHLNQLFDSGLGPTATALLADEGVTDATYSLAPVFEEDASEHEVSIDYSRVDLGPDRVATAGLEELYPTYGEPQREGVEWSHYLDKRAFAADNTDRIEVKPVVLAIQGAGHALDKGLLHLLTKPNVPNSLYETDIVRILVAHKWAAFGKDMFLGEVFVYMLMLASFQVLVLMVANYGADAIAELSKAESYGGFLLAAAGGTFYLNLNFMR